MHRYKAGTNEPQEIQRTAARGPVECRECGRSFRRTGDWKRHKCITEKEKPVKKQRVPYSVLCVSVG